MHGTRDLQGDDQIREYLSNLLHELVCTCRDEACCEKT